MKQVLILLSIGCALLSYGQNIKKNDLQERKLHGKVKSVREISYSAVEKLGKIGKGGIIVDSFWGTKNTLTLFNKQGNKIEENEYNADGSLAWKETYQYTYNEKGNWIKKVEYVNGKPYSITERTIEYYP